MGSFSKKQPVSVIRPSWDFYAYSYGEGERASISFDVEAARTEHDGESACRRVILFSSPERAQPNGLPTAEEHGYLQGLQRELTQRLEEDRIQCWLVGRMLYRAMSDIVFQVDDVPGFTETFQRWRSTHPGRRIELTASEGWDFFDARVRPKPEHWKWIDNNHLVIALLDAGTDVSQAHQLDHTFIGDEVALDLVTAYLDDFGFDRHHRPEVTRLAVEQKLRLSVDEITTWTLVFERIATECGARYDGWGSAVRPRE